MLDSENLVRFVTEALMITTKLSLPSILVAAGVGTCVAIIQAITQIQEQTLAFAIKLIAIGLVVLLSMNSMTGLIYAYTVRGFEIIATLG